MSDFVSLYGESLSLSVRPKTVLVEGTSDEELFLLASDLEFRKTGIRLIDDDFNIIAAGKRDSGGVNGVVREFIALRGMARTCLLANGRPKYRFIALLDNDNAGRVGVKTLRNIDTSILEYRDVFRLYPVMPFPGMLDPSTVESAFVRENVVTKGLDWELEDLIDFNFLRAFELENPSAVLKTHSAGKFSHREFSRDGKAKLFHFTKRHAVLEDVADIVAVTRLLRFLMGAIVK